MASLHDQLDLEIRQLLRQGCNPNQVVQELTATYPQLISQSAQVLKLIHAIERDLRKHADSANYPDDPDESLEIRPEIHQQLLAYRERRARGERGIPAEEVAKRLGMTWQ